MQEASECLKKHTQHIRHENQQLRRELQELIEVTSSLQLHKKKLEKQYSNLLREHQFSQNLKQLRGSVFQQAGGAGAGAGIGAGAAAASNVDLSMQGDFAQGSDAFLPQL